MQIFRKFEAYLWIKGKAGSGALLAVACGGAP